MTAPTKPRGLGDGGSKLWRETIRDHPALNPQQLVQLHEACRCKDRLDKLDEVIRGDTDVWLRLTSSINADDEDERLIVVKIDSALIAANNTANMFKQLLAAMRLPDQLTGKQIPARPARGAYVVGGGAGAATVSPLERARAARSS